MNEWMDETGRKLNRKNRYNVMPDLEVQMLVDYHREFPQQLRVPIFNLLL